MSSSAQYWTEPRGLRILWGGILLGPAAWALSLQTNYTLAAFACDGQWPLLLHVVSLVSLLVAAASGWMSWRSWQSIGGAGYDVGESEPQPQIGRSRFMAASGVVLSAMFAITIVAQWIPMFFQQPCRY